MNQYAEIWQAMQSGETVILNTVLKGKSGMAAEQIQRSLEPVPKKADAQEQISLSVKYEQQEDSIMLSEPMMPQERLVILGGGHISQILADFAAKCGFYVVVVDDREEFANKERFPLASQIIQNEFAEAIHHLNITSYDYVVIVSRGHANDAECLRAILSGEEPFYTGQIGSRKRVKAQFEMLVQEGYSKERIERIYTPIGLDIGGVTPAEIAVAILAELISCKRKTPQDARRTIIANASDLDPEVVRMIAENQRPAALATLLVSEGSTPRKAGAKMLVFEDGTIAGTIGGGSGEGIAMKMAVGLIGTGRYEIVELNMDASVAAKEGMACGGRMKVLIEDL